MSQIEDNIRPDLITAMRQIDAKSPSVARSKKINIQIFELIFIQNQKLYYKNYSKYILFIFVFKSILIHSSPRNHFIKIWVKNLIMLRFLFYPFTYENSRTPPSLSGGGKRLSLDTFFGFLPINLLSIHV